MIYIVTGISAQADTEVIKKLGKLKSMLNTQNYCLYEI